MKIAIDTTERGTVRVRIDRHGKTVRRTRKMFAEKLLIFLDSLFKKDRLKLIAVVAGPGAFSATRNGVAIANALSYGRKIPIVAITKEQFDAPAPLPEKGTGESIAVVYGSEPNITKKKARL